jgi:hypothetical protein
VQRRADVDLVEDLRVVLHGDKDGLDVHRVHEVALQVPGLVQSPHRERRPRAVLAGKHQLVVRPLAVLQPDAVELAREKLHRLDQASEPRVRGDVRRLLAPEAARAGGERTRDAVEGGDGVDGAERVKVGADDGEHRVCGIGAHDRVLDLELARLVRAGRAAKHRRLA